MRAVQVWILAALARFLAWCERIVSARLERARAAPPPADMPAPPPDWQTRAHPAPPDHWLDAVRAGAPQLLDPGSDSVIDWRADEWDAPTPDLTETHPSQHAAAQFETHDPRRPARQPTLRLINPHFAGPPQVRQSPRSVSPAASFRPMLPLNAAGQPAVHVRQSGQTARTTRPPVRAAGSTVAGSPRAVVPSLPADSDPVSATRPAHPEPPSIPQPRHTGRRADTHRPTVEAASPHQPPAPEIPFIATQPPVIPPSRPTTPARSQWLPSDVHAAQPADWWPSLLPDEPPGAAFNPIEWQHLQRLDAEQRGDAWNG